MPSFTNARRNAGFTLIELMIAAVLGALVIGAVFTLVVSMMRANRDTIATTRLTQELRAIAQIISSDLRRAGSANDPFLLSGTGSIADFTLTAPTSGSSASTATYRYGGLTADRTVSLSNGQVTIGGTVVSSNAVNITALTFNRTAPRLITFTLTGNLRNGSASTTGVSRSFVQTVFMPSVVTP